MHRYHFDLHENHHFYRDEDGRKYDDDAAARTGAIRRLIEVLEGMPPTGTETKLIVMTAP